MNAKVSHAAHPKGPPCYGSPRAAWPVDHARAYPVRSGWEAIRRSSLPDIMQPGGAAAVRPSARHAAFVLFSRDDEGLFHHYRPGTIPRHGLLGHRDQPVFQSALDAHSARPDETQVGGTNADIASIRELKAKLVGENGSYWADQVEILNLTASAWQTHAAGKAQEAVRLMRAAANREATIAKTVAMENPLVPMRELLAEMFMGAE